MRAAIFPIGRLTDETVDSAVTKALADGLVPCTARRGPFRIAFFPADAIPATWLRMGVTTVPPRPAATVQEAA